jgi:hypothetical protein
MISDSWEAINAKLQYEKHLQDSNNATAVQNNSLPITINDSVQRSQFYQNSNNNSNSQNLNNSKLSSGNLSGSSSSSSSGGGKIMDIQTSFGEILHPAPAAFSPQFTRKNYRIHDAASTHVHGTAHSGATGGARTSSSSGGEGEGGDEADGGGSTGEDYNSGDAQHQQQHHSGGGGAISKFSPSKPPKTVFIRSVSAENASAQAALRANGELGPEGGGSGEFYVAVCL